MLSFQKLFGRPLNEAIANENAHILFVFNGQDLVKVQREVRVNPWASSHLRLV